MEDMTTSDQGPGRRLHNGRWRTPLNPSEAAELDEYASRPDLCRLPPADLYWTAHLDYARRAATALASGQLFEAQRAAAISTYALALHLGHTSTTDPPSRLAAVTHAPY